MGSNKLEVEATINNWPNVHRFLDEYMQIINLSNKVAMNIIVSCEEIYINIVKYAYPLGTGDVTVTINYDSDKNILILEFKDCGIPFDPTKVVKTIKKESISDKEYGGFGIFIVKKFMDNMRYTRTESYNILTLTKKIS